jgi:hypothetical protein
VRDIAGCGNCYEPHNLLKLMVVRGHCDFLRQIAALNDSHGKHISSQVHSLQEPHLQILAGTYCSGATWNATRNLIDSVKPGRPGRWGQRLTAAKMKECI